MKKQKANRCAPKVQEAKGKATRKAAFCPLPFASCPLPLAFCLLPLAFCFLPLSHSVAQVPVFRPYPLKGLARETRVNTLLQSHNGYLWMGTEAGLYRSNGRESIAVALPDTTCPPVVTALVEQQGQIWVGFQSGCVARLDPAPGRPLALQVWHPEEGTPAKPITGFATDHAGDLWFATYGEGLYCWKQGRLYQFNAADDGLAGDDLYAITSDGQGRIWAASDAGVSICSMPEPGKKQVQTLGLAQGLPDELVTALCTDHHGNVWIGTHDRGLAHFNLKEQRFDYLSPPNWPYGSISQLALDDADDLWIGTETSGLLTLPAAGHMGSQNIDFQRYSSGVAPVQLQGKAARVRALLGDREGLIWVAADNQYLCAANTLFGFSPNTPTDVQAILMAPGAGGRRWLGTSEGLFWEENGAFRAVLPQQNVISLWASPDQQEVWVGTFGQGVLVLDANTGRVRQRLNERDGLPNGSVLSIAGTANQVWLATLGGAVQLVRDPQGARLQPLELGTHYVYSVLVDHLGRVWFGTDGGGLAVLENGAVRHIESVNGIALHTVYSVVEDHHGRIWFSTDRAGLFCYDGGQYTHYGTAEGLRRQPMVALASLPDDRLLVAYENGMDFVDLAQGGHITFSDAETGLPEATVNLNAVYTDAIGHIWLGAKEGLLRVDPQWGTSASRQPLVQINEVLLYLQSIDFQSKKSFSHEENYLAFRFDGVWNTRPDALRYRYRLDGFDIDWHPTRDLLASYPKLPPGTYTFRVQASIDGTFVGAAEATYQFTVRRPLWAEWWVLTPSLALLLALLVWWLQQREARIQRENQLQRERAEAQLAAIKSHINPHFLFNSLNTLVSVIEDNPHVAVTYVEQLADFYRSVMLYRERDVIPLDEELALVRNFDFLLRQRYEHSFRLNIHIADNSVAGSRIVPFALQMLVENAVKHNVISASNPLEVDISLSADQRFVVVSNRLQRKLKPEVSTHFGLQSLRKRYALLGGAGVEVDDSGGYFVVKVPLVV